MKRITGDVVVAVLLAVAVALVIDRLRPRKRKRVDSLVFERAVRAAGAVEA
jgi:hypothetical protein